LRHDEKQQKYFGNDQNEIGGPGNQSETTTFVHFSIEFGITASEGDLFVPGMTIATNESSSTVAREFKSAASDE
jgi:hypothetical protein